MRSSLKESRCCFTQPKKRVTLLLFFFCILTYVCRLDSLLDVNNFMVANGFVVNEFMVVNGFTVYGECNEFNEVIF